MAAGATQRDKSELTTKMRKDDDERRGRRAASVTDQMEADGDEAVSARHDVYESS